MDKAKVVCKFFAAGNCRRDKDCHWLHPAKEYLVEIPTSNSNGPALTEVPIPCKFFLKGECLKGNDCNFYHPLVSEESGKGNEEVEHKCGVCFERIGQNFRKLYGLLRSCDHIFCLDCIRSWRSSDNDSRTTHTCPFCRVQSHFVIPSVVYATGEQKDKIETAYKERLKKIPCKYYKFGSGVCPFGRSCFYGHLTEEGTPGYTPPYSPKRRLTDVQNFLGEVLGLEQWLERLIGDLEEAASVRQIWNYVLYDEDEIGGRSDSEEEV
eukprot:TRINITY_DN2735_c0_g1_i1.p1 TRINITY_DN2735_c0_g1~~TRINITY_DN2735_c0_g1_i1.p1  ORF type:complete len:266 (+),score=42.30 TRINITY_DN2735_c0_g1_i1:57-854(+)